MAGITGILHICLTCLVLFLAIFLSGAVAKTVLFLCLLLAVPRLLMAFLIISLSIDETKLPLYRPFLLTVSAVESLMALSLYFFDYLSVAQSAGVLFGIPGVLLMLILPVCFCLFNLILALYLLSYKGSSGKKEQYNEHYLPEFRETVIEE
jgi:hypothetical protein